MWQLKLSKNTEFVFKIWQFELKNVPVMALSLSRPLNTNRIQRKVSKFARFYNKECKEIKIEEIKCSFS